MAVTFILFYDSNILLCIYIFHILSQSSIDGHLGSFHVLAVVNSAAVNIEVCVFFFFNVKNFYLFVWLSWVLVLACGIFEIWCGMWTLLSCDMWDLVPWPGIKPRPPVLGAQSLSHWIPERSLECMYHFELEFLPFLNIYPGVGLLMIWIFFFFKEPPYDFQ